MKILLISYYFPPCGGAPVQRWLRFLPYLCQKGHSITVLCSADGDYPFWDPDLLKQVPNEIKVIRVRGISMNRIWRRLTGSSSKMPYGKIPKQGNALSRSLVWLRLNLILPDLRVFWNPFARQAALDELKKAPYDLIISTGPPHSSHLVARNLSRQLKKRWFADFRDPLSQIHYLQLNPPSKPALKILKKMEQEILASADLSLVVSQAISDSLPQGKKLVLHNGYEPKDFEALSHHESDVFRIKYIGQITAGQDIGIFAKLCENLMRDFSLSMIGTKLEDGNEAMLRKSCKERFALKDFLPHQQALQEMVDCDLLLLIINRQENNRGILTTKLFEYLASRTPILCFSSADTDAAGIITKSKAGSFFDYDDVTAAANWVDNLPQGYRTNGNISSYSIATQADILHEAIIGKIVIDK